MPRNGCVMLSEYPEAKITLACDKCGRHARYDRADLLAAGGDRTLPDLRKQIAQRMGCLKTDNVASSFPYDACRLCFPDLSRLVR